MLAGSAGLPRRPGVLPRRQGVLPRWLPQRQRPPRRQTVLPRRQAVMQAG